MAEHTPGKLRPLVILGAGGHAVSIANVAMSVGYEIAYFVDNYKKCSNLLNIEIINDISVLTDKSEFVYSIAMGDNFNRERIYNELLKHYCNLCFPSLVHQSAVISHFAKIGVGTVVMPKAVVGPNSVVGKFCILNTQSSIDHDCVMSDFSSMAPNAVTGGAVKIGCRSAISIGAVVKHGIEIGEDSVLGANSYLNKNLANNCVAYGTPTKVIRAREIGDAYLT
jgi:sugar O-acyltransferase (sialic acid O-acetyltransferase NeuD family)